MNIVSIASMATLILALMTGSASAAAYQAGSTTMTLDAGACDTRTVRIDCADFGTSRLVGGGFYIDTAGAVVSITDPVLVYDGVERMPAVWDTGGLKVPDPYDPPHTGDYFLALSNLGAGVTPAAGVPIADVEFCCNGAGESTVTIGLDPDPDYDLWVTQDQVVHDDDVSAFIIAVTCNAGGAVCGNGIQEGDEECDGGSCCTAECALEPAGTSCSDDLYCNGEETCDAKGVCQNGTPVICQDDGLYCTGSESCNESTDSCISSGNPCPSELPVCVEETDSCQTEGLPASIQLTPDTWYQSRWVPLIKLLSIEGSETHFDKALTAVTFTPDNAIIMLPRVINQAAIRGIGILMPGWLVPVDSIEVTVTTGTEEATDTLEIKLLPFFLEHDHNRLRED